MAIFASTTTSGYSDPMKALSIKALEQRQKDMLAQMAAQPGITPENTQTPIQGFGHLANQLGDQFRQGRVEAATAARRQELAGVMAGVDWDKGPTPQQIAQINSADPELAKQALTTLAENRRAAAQNLVTSQGQDKTLKGVQEGHQVQREGQTSTAATAAEGHQIQREGQAQTAEQAKASQQIQREGQQLQLDLADKATLARREEAIAEREWKGAQADMDRAEKTGDREAQIAARATLQEKQQAFELKKQESQNAWTASQPKSKPGEVKADVANKILTPEEGATALKPEIKPAQITGAAAAKETYTQHLLSIEKLKQAKEALDHPGGLYTGPWQSAQVLGAQATGGVLGDKEKAQRTTDYNNVINEIAIGTMSKTLKGQSTDFEMQEFKKIFNNPNSSDAARKTALDRLIRAAESDKTTHAEAVKAFGGDTSRIDEQLNKSKSGGGGATTPGADGVVKGITEAEALKLPPNTKFELKDGRTGVTE